MSGLLGHRDVADQRGERRDHGLRRDRGGHLHDHAGQHAVADIIGFKANDHITLTRDFTAADAASAVSTATTGVFGTTLNLSDGTKVNLFGVSITAAQVSVG